MHLLDSRGLKRNPEYSYNAVLFFIIKLKHKKIRKIKAFYQTENLFKKLDPVLELRIKTLVNQVKDFLLLFDIVLMTYFQILGSIDKMLVVKTEEAI